MARRVSPEGRERARRERERRAAITRRRWGAILPALLVVLVAALFFGPLSLVVTLPLLLLTIIASAVLTRERPATPGRLATADLPQLPAHTATWLEAQRPALPAPAVRLVDDISARLEGLAPQLARLDPAEPAGDAVRKLLATELPGLVGGYQGVPPSLRATPGADGVTPDAQLLHGLGVVDGEIARMTEQLARGALDEVATQTRYLGLKYQGDSGLRE